MKNKNKTAEVLVLVDMQTAFSIPPKMVGRVRKYADRFSRRVFTRFVNPPGSLFRRKLKQSSCEPGSADLELVIEPRRGDILLEKSGYGLNQNHIRRLMAAGVKRAIVCGVDTDACVLGVMFSLFDAGIEPRVKKDLCWSSTGLQREAMKILHEQFPQPI